MILSFALWAGLFAVPVALLLLIPRRTRRFSAPLALLGIAMIAIAVAWPVTEQRVVSHATHLDQIMPVWQFSERHAIHVNASPERIFQAIHQVTAGEILFFRTLIAIRRFGRPLPPGILNAPKDESLLDLATRTSFRYVDNDPPRELVVATIIIPPRQAERPSGERSSSMPACCRMKVTSGQASASPAASAICGANTCRSKLKP